MSLLMKMACTSSFCRFLHNRYFISRSCRSVSSDEWSVDSATSGFRGEALAQHVARVAGAAVSGCGCLGAGEAGGASLTVQGRKAADHPRGRGHAGRSAFLLKTAQKAVLIAVEKRLDERASKLKF